MHFKQGAFSYKDFWPLCQHYNVHIFQLEQSRVGLLIYSRVVITRIIKAFSKNERTCKDIKTDKAHEQDWDGTLAT